MTPEPRDLRALSFQPGSRDGPALPHPWAPDAVAQASDHRDICILSKPNPFNSQILQQEVTAGDTLVIALPLWGAQGLVDTRWPNVPGGWFRSKRTARNNVGAPRSSER